jgi:hypothetical protein
MGLGKMDCESSGESFEFRRRTVITVDFWDACMLFDRQWKDQQGNRITKAASLPRY